MKKLHPWLRLLVWKDSLAMRQAAFLQRRPHRSFRRTFRRDYKRSLNMPGYWAFTGSVWKMLWVNKRTFGKLAILYAAIAVMLGGITNQEAYQQISDLFNESAGEVIKGAWGSLGQAGVLMIAAFATPGDINPETQILLSLTGLLVWMSTVWLLREIMAGHKPKLRDGIYSSGSPIVPTTIVTLVAMLQLIPLALVALVYVALSSVGILQEGLGMMLFWVFAVLVATLTLYWMTATFLGLVVVTLPGMYPLRALKYAGDAVVGRRLRILYRILWLLFTVILFWAVIMIPAILADSALKHAWPAIQGVPFVPLLAALMGAFTLIWCSTYIYMLYRKVIADDSSPA